MTATVTNIRAKQDELKARREHEALRDWVRILAKYRWDIDRRPMWKRALRSRGQRVA